MVDGHDTTLIFLESMIEGSTCYCLKTVTIYSLNRKSKRSSTLGEHNRKAFFRLLRRWLELVGAELATGRSEYEVVIRCCAAYLGPIEMMRVLALRHA